MNEPHKQYGFIKGTLLYDWDKHASPVEILCKSAKILGKHADKFIPAMLGVRYSRFTQTLIELKVSSGRLLGCPDQTIFTLCGFKRLEDITDKDIVYRAFEDPQPILTVKTINAIAPVYVINSYPEIPFIVSGFISGSIEESPHVES